jgi:predicted NBD/HSP70 family sugar kinase
MSRPCPEWECFARMGVELTTNAVLRHINAIRCLRVLRRATPLSRADIARELNVTRATVGNSIKQLLGESLVIDLNESAEASGAGRPGALVALNPDGAYFIGLDISTSAINAVLIDFTMRIVAKKVVSIAHCFSQPDEVIGLLSTLPQELIRTAGIKSKRVRGLCVSIPGIVREGRVVSAPWLNWRDIDLATPLALHSKPYVKIQICNDAVALASAVRAEAAESELDDVLLLLLAQGIGSALIRQGKVVKGAHGLGGEVGHMVMGQSANLSASKTFEILAGYQRFLPLIADGRTISDGLVELAQGEPTKALQQVLGEWAEALAAGFLNLVHILDPQSVVLGGPLAVLYARVSERVEKAVQENLVHGFKVPPISIARFGADGAAIGAAALLREDLFDLPDLSPS